MPAPLETRFWAKVKKGNPADCWEWMAARNNGGYGNLAYGRNAQGNWTGRMAHRISWELHNGPIPKGEGHPGICVLHRCDNRLCVNPAHLFLGTNADNVADREAKGRNRPACGESHYLSKLSESDVRNIRKLYADGGISQPELGRYFQVSQTLIWSVIHSRGWKHIPIHHEQAKTREAAE